MSCFVKTLNVSVNKKGKMLVLRVTIFIRILQIALCKPIDVEEIEEIMRTYTPNVYFDNLRNSRGMDTTIPPYFLASYAADLHATVNSLNATVNSLNANVLEQNVVSCARLFRNVGTYFQNTYMIPHYMNSHPEFRKLREEHFQRKFEFLFLEYREVDRNSEKYRHTFVDMYGKALERSPLSESERYYLFTKYLLTSTEWKQSSSTEELQSFYDSLKKYSWFEFIPSNHEKIAVSFGSCWYWLWRFVSYTNKGPIGLPGTDVNETINYVNVFANFAKNTTASTYCAKVMLEMTEENPSIVVASIPKSQSHTIREWWLQE